jgi:hypothetical protein
MRSSLQACTIMGLLGQIYRRLNLPFSGLDMDWEDSFRRLRKESESVYSLRGLDNIEYGTKGLESLQEPVSSPEPSEKIEKISNQAASSVTSEKEKVLSGLKGLAEVHLKETGGSIKFPGGEVKVVENDPDSSEVIDLVLSENSTKLKVLFVYNYSADALELPAAERSSAPSEQLLDRMIGAMKMESHEFEKLVVETGERDLFLNHLINREVDVVVPMGAVATNLVLGKQERISMVHGKFFDKELTYRNDQVRQFKIVPVFNPEMILINPSMKRSTWTDLQKIMEHLGIDSK